jgi:hypothetical protein
MANVRNLRKAASSLLDVSKKAFKFIRDNPSGSASEREALLRALQAVIDLADPPLFDESGSTVTLTMTPTTYTAILASLRARPDDKDAVQAILEGTHETKQRVYVKLDLNHITLNKIYFVLRHTATRPQEKSFKRLAFAVEAGLNKNPMEILARNAL